MKYLSSLFTALCLLFAASLALASPLVIDVRSPAEFAQEHVQGALNLPLDSIARTIARSAPDKSAPIALYCRSGRRSAEAEQQLRALGYTAVRNLGGVAEARKLLARP
ncbi:rhodanese-like domain-containing protein [Craterilacuibacter sp.]|uniref:rhodanese-like domain-containing protein n=1 Tax=Craterilacuibacter sp. TaxID=2870909 RepID=UPI003F3F80A1